MATPHISASPGEIAKTVLMPGDPLRAKFVAETFLEQPVQFNQVRGMLGFTGRYQGKYVSVMGSGMGMPSIGIYSYELYTRYGVENIIRIGSAGSYCDKLNLFDLLLVTAAWSESSFAKVQNGFEGEIILPDSELCDKLRASAKSLGYAMEEGTVHSSDVFYQEDKGTDIPYWQTLYQEKGCLAVEMESFALFHNARVTGKRAACLLTISDSFVSHQETTPQQREKSFTAMMEVALGIL
ncbi:MAG: purine-nucleoside phosphorylase [Oscillospiraceae bacterium]